MQEKPVVGEQPYFATSELAEIHREDLGQLAAMFWNKLDAFNSALKKNSMENSSIDELLKSRIPGVSLFPRDLTNSGLSSDEVTTVLNASSEAEIFDFFDSRLKKESVQIRDFLSDPEINTKLKIASERLQTLFAQAGSAKNDSDTKVVHAGTTARLLMNAKKYSYSFIPHILLSSVNTFRSMMLLLSIMIFKQHLKSLWPLISTKKLISTQTIQ